ncbi:signal peptide peptidase-like 2B isoform X2 [Sciurus carolinensis]|uniref:signal peptide peptidase-like 2B isoform X2 n=1 Tax=Sciurus carolinensis TaxID=30640 RepID=UPI001FB2DCD3|nr:signal peptide peptidase-like 2B isoform X2 [Sciurus carolinensis]
MAAAALARLATALLLLEAQVACEYGMVHVLSESGTPRGKDYCILYNPQWAHLPQDLGKAVSVCSRLALAAWLCFLPSLRERPESPQAGGRPGQGPPASGAWSLLQLRNWTASLLCSPSDLPASGFGNQIPLVARGNCTFYEKVRLAQSSGARGLLIVSKEKLVPPGGNKTQYEEIGIPVALLSHRDMLDIFRSFGQAARVALYAPSEPVLDYNMVIIFIMAVGTVAVGGYWAGSRDVKKSMKHKRDDGPEKQEDEAVDVTPVMICVFVVLCCCMLVLLYHLYDQLVYAIIGIFCLASSTGLYSCLAPCVRRLPFCRCRVPDNSLPYFHKRPQARMLLLALFCIAVSVVWGVFRNEDQWAWVLQDALGVAFCLYMLKTIRLPTFKACTLLLLVLFIYDVFFVFVTPFLTRSGNSIMVEVATGPSDSATREKLPMVLKVPRLSASPLALCDRPFSLLGFGDILVPGIEAGLALPAAGTLGPAPALRAALEQWVGACRAATRVGEAWHVAPGRQLLQGAGAGPRHPPLGPLPSIRPPRGWQRPRGAMPGCCWAWCAAWAAAEAHARPRPCGHRTVPVSPHVAGPQDGSSGAALGERGVPAGLLVAYCHRFGLQAQSSRIYFVACTVAYGVGLLVTFVALALMQRGQPALLYLVPCTLVTSFLVALWRRELGAFWTGSGFAKDLPQTQWAPAPADSPQPPKDSDAPLSPQPASQEPVRSTVPPEQPQEPSTPEATEASAPAQEPRTLSSSTLESEGQTQAQPSPAAQPGTSA